MFDKQLQMIIFIWIIHWYCFSVKLAMLMQLSGTPFPHQPPPPPLYNIFSVEGRGGGVGVERGSFTLKHNMQKIENIISKIGAEHYNLHFLFTNTKEVIIIDSLVPVNITSLLDLSPKLTNFRHYGSKNVLIMSDIIYL